MSSKPTRILPEADLGSHHTPKMELSAKKFNGFKLLDIFTKISHVRCVTDLEFASDFNKKKHCLLLCSDKE